MNKNGFFFSLKWKIAILISGIFLLLHSVFSYLVYLDAIEGHQQSRQNIQRRHKDIAHALTKDSFLVLDQFAELFSVLETEQETKQSASTQIISTLDKNWQQWQFIWGLESAVLYDQNGGLLKHWGGLLQPDPPSILHVLKNELPNHEILCEKSCFQFVLIPVMANAEVIGIFGVSRSFADTIIEYQRATASDIAVLVNSKKTSSYQWPYTASVLTHAKLNNEIILRASQDYLFEDLINDKKNISYQEKTYELSVFTINTENESTSSPFFLLIDDVSEELLTIDDHIKTVWLYGLFGLLASLAFLIIILVLSLRRITQLSNALPLLAQQRFDEFKNIFVSHHQRSISHDELDILNRTAMTLTDQLAGMESNIKTSIKQLIDQGLELTTERDFVQQLLNVAPILILTQDANGRILSINQEGIDEFAIDKSLILGSVFDIFLPDTEIDHISQLKNLRTGKHKQHITIDGLLLANPVRERHISWIHSPISPTKNQQESMVLTLGVDISERKQAELQILNRATEDTLTGLGNRNKFLIDFNRELSLAKRYKAPLALFYIDIDHFKMVNNIGGYKTGDQLLRLISINLQEVIRNTDTLSRITGDEFTLIMPNANKDGIEHLAHKIHQRLMSLDFIVDDITYKISCSLGIATYPQHGTESNELLSNAVAAKFHAKQSGGSQSHQFSLENNYHLPLSINRYWEEIIENALENDRFILLFQPIMDLKTGKICQYECSSQIKSRDGTTHLPTEYMSVAEELQLMSQIDQKVLKQTISQHITFQQQGKKIKLIINLSSQSLNDTAFVDNISLLLKQQNVDPKQIIFSITETTAVSNFSDVYNFIIKIRVFGSMFTLDNFGAGFSSFNFLEHLPVDYVKIDSSFIQKLDKKPENIAYIKALAEVSHALGKKTIAKMVEDKSTLEKTKALGIDYAQGYYIGIAEKFDIE